MTELPKPGQLWQLKEMRHCNFQLSKFWATDNDGNRLHRIWAGDLSLMGITTFRENVVFESLPELKPDNVVMVTDVTALKKPIFPHQTTETASKCFLISCIFGDDVFICFALEGGWQYHANRVA